MKNCEYCLTEEANHELSDEISVCSKCLFLLQQRGYGIRLIRGHLTMKLRGLIDKSILEKMVNQAVKLIESESKKRPDNN
jgi:hypothetical protein